MRCRSVLTCWCSAARSTPRYSRVSPSYWTGRPSVACRCAYASATLGSDVVAVRDREEGISGTLAAKIRSALTYYRPLAEVDGCEVRLHSTTLYASLFRYDDEILMNPHVYGEPASANPTFHLRRLDGGTLAAHYM